MIIGMICNRPHCENEVSADRVARGALYCRPQCKRRNKPAVRRYQAKRNATRRNAGPWAKFVNVSARRVPVKPDKRSQAQARVLLTAKKVVAYENKDGVICDVGVPKKKQRGGEIYSRRAELLSARSV
jgi:hypothetical protein